MSKNSGEVRIGISGWRYAGWRRTFYPPDLPQRLELDYVARRFNTVEINGSFYSLQRPERYTKWRDETPDDFVFAVKGGRYITHMKRLVEIERPLANFFASGVLELRDKLGPLLWQFPASLPFDERFERFLQLLPRTQKDAVSLAKHHDDKLSWPFVAPSGVDQGLRHAVEVRSRTFMTTEFVELLRKHDVGLVVADTPAFPFFEDITSSFVYVRLHGGEKLYESAYSPAALDHWAARVRSWASGRSPRDVYVYFDNDAKVKAPYDAAALAGRLGVRWPQPEEQKSPGLARRGAQEGTRARNAS